MKNKKTISILFVLAICLILHQNAVAQKTQALISKTVPSKRSEVVSGDHQPVAKKTRELMSNTLLSKGSEILGDDNQLFLVNVGKPAIGIMKDSSNPDDIDFWYVTMSGFTHESVEASAEGTTDDSSEPPLPKVFALSQNFPNPFNPSTTINFQLPEKNGSENIRTVLKVYDILGRLVRTVVDEDLLPGLYSRRWNGLTCLRQ